MMSEAQLAPLAAWQTFYVLLGSAAATLTGLLFVVVTLVSGTLGSVSSPWSRLRAFNNPNVVHFGAALVIAALLITPWPVLWPAGMLVGLVGLGGAIYVFIALWELRHRLSYPMVFSDWLWYTTLPLITYIALLVAGPLLPLFYVLALFAIAAGTLLLVIMGIRNAWDIMTYMIIEGPQRENKSQE